MGCFYIWTENIFHKLDDVYGTWCEAASLKSNHNLSMHKMLNIDLSRILKSPEIQRAHDTQEDSSQSPEEESPEKLDNHAEAKPICKDHMLDGTPFIPRTRITNSGWIRQQQCQQPNQMRRGFQGRNLWWRRKERRLLVLGSKRGLLWAKMASDQKTTSWVEAHRKETNPRKKQSAEWTYICAFHKGQIILDS